MEIKKLRAMLVGAGNRGCVYADYALQMPSELEIVGVVEPNDLRREEAAERYSLDRKNCFRNLDEFLQAKIDCDFVINATMDEMHYETAKKLMTAAFDF